MLLNETALFLFSQQILREVHVWAWPKFPGSIESFPKLWSLGNDSIPPSTTERFSWNSLLVISIINVGGIKGWVHFGGDPADEKGIFFPQFKSSRKTFYTDGVGTTAAVITRPGPVTGLIEGRGQSRLPSKSQALSSQTPDSIILGEASAARLYCALWDPTCSECLLAVTADKPWEFLLWGGSKSFTETLLAAVTGGGNSQASLKLEVICETSQGWELLHKSSLLSFLDWFRSLQGKS